MKIISVNDSRGRKLFHDTARAIYSNDEVWVCPLDKDIEDIFTVGRNPYFSHGDARRWVALDDKGNPVGRIAAFIDRNLAWLHDQPTGGIGFFECIDDNDTATALFDTAREWLIGYGMAAMDGPINFGEVDKYWGLLVEGFTHPSFDVPYNPPYYRDLFESYGFMKYYGMEGFHVAIPEKLPERFAKIAEWISAKPGYQYLHLTWKDRGKLVADFAKVFNEAWSNFKTTFEPVTVEYINAALDKAKPVVDEKLIWIAYHEGNPVGILLCFPDVNQILKHMNGKINLFNMIRFIYLKKRKTMTRIKGLVMGVIPKYQGLGLESALFFHLHKELVKKPHYREIELSWVGDFNPKMRRTFVTTGGYPAKKYITYRYLFDRTKEFRRYPIPENFQDK